LRDEYAADDTNIRVFDLTSGTPKEVEGLNRHIQETILSHISAGETTLWLTYPEVCFAAAGSSTIFLTADAPRVPKAGSGSGKRLAVKLAVNLVTLKVSELSVRRER